MNCEYCSKTLKNKHKNNDIGFIFKYPTNWMLLDKICGKTLEKNNELCYFEDKDGKHYFILCSLRIPLLNERNKLTKKTLNISVWIAIDYESYEEISKSWDNTNRIENGSYMGWLMNEIPGFNVTTLFLKCRIHIQPLYFRPIVSIEPTQHELSRSMQSGISLQKLNHIRNECTTIASMNNNNNNNTINN